MQDRVTDLQQALSEARARTLMLASDLSDAQLLGPRLTIVNPPLWELGHLAWFQERWCLRPTERGCLLPSMRDDADRLYDSAAVAHDVRWDLPLPTLDQTLDYLRIVLARVLERLSEAPTESLFYFAELASLHEEMHCEAFTYTRQTLGYRAPPSETLRMASSEAQVAKGDVSVPGTTFMLGAARNNGFVFDNEKWAHPVTIGSFSMSKTCVTNAEFVAFVEDAGYMRRELWSEEGWRWRESCGATQPVYWRKSGAQWHVRIYADWEPIEPDKPVVHVNWYEADAYCRWAARRLPSEAEWEYAACSDPANAHSKRKYPWGDEAPNASRANLYGGGSTHVAHVAAYPCGEAARGFRQMIGNVWEWTADAFQPYPGFVPDPYKEYSQPWFGDHKVLRGGCFATGRRLIRNTWRNFYTPDRRDVFAGFRTCSLDPDGPAHHVG